MHKMCLEFDFTYAMQFSSRSVNPLSYFIYIYIYENYNRNYLEKYIVNQKILMHKMCLEFDFTYAMQISSRSVNPLSYFIYIYIYMKTIIVIISKNNSKIENFSRTICA